MRDIARIKRITDKLARVWELGAPDQRLGQLLQNYVFGRVDPFFQEDDRTEELLDDLIKQIDDSIKQTNS
jgi:hypothetical protein